MFKKSKIAIMMLTLNSEKHFKNGVLESLKRALKDYDYELIVIDSGSKDNTVNILREIFKDKLHLVHCPIKNLAVCRNLAIQKAMKDFDFLCFIDSDIMLPENFFDRLIPLFDDPTIGTAELKAVLGYPKKTLVSEYYKHVKTAQGKGVQDAIGGATTCIIIRPEIASKIKLNERFRRAGEDVELHLQVNMLGYRTVVDMNEPFAKHIRTPSLIEELKRMYYRGMARALNLKLYKKLLNDNIGKSVLIAVATLFSWVLTALSITFSFYPCIIPLLALLLRHAIKLDKPYRLDLAIVGLLISTSYLTGLLIGFLKYYLLEK